MKWSKTLSVICNRNITLKFKEKFYKTTVKLIILYKVKCGANTWAEDKNYRNKDIKINIQTYEDRRNNKW